MFGSGTKPPTPPPSPVSEWRRIADIEAAFGCEAQDTLTGFSGRIVGHTRYISGCSQVLISPPVDKDGKFL
jgi:hypothetical protein